MKKRTDRQSLVFLRTIRVVIKLFRQFEQCDLLICKLIKSYSDETTNKSIELRAYSVFI